jgi:hypothetical protein
MQSSMPVDLNRSAADRLGVIAGLQAEVSALAPEMLERMRESEGEG